MTLRDAAIGYGVAMVLLGLMLWWNLRHTKTCKYCYYPIQRCACKKTCDHSWWPWRWTQDGWTQDGWTHVCKRCGVWQYGDDDFDKGPPDARNVQG